MPKPKYPRFKYSKSLDKEFCRLTDDPDWTFHRGKKPKKVRRMDYDSYLMFECQRYYYPNHTSWKKNRKTQYR